jgi:hypothetical protein
MKAITFALVLFLSCSTIAHAADPTGYIGFKTVKFWQGLDRTSQLYYLMGALDAMILSCANDIATLGAMENVLRNRIRDGIVRSDDKLWTVIDDVAVDFACRTLFTSTPAPSDVTPVGR